jgi:uncharacterized membrane protein YhhN
MTRTIWWAAILCGVGYGLAGFTDWRVPMGAQAATIMTVWKGACVGLLALWAAMQARSVDGWLLTTVLALGAIGDVLLNTHGLVVGGAVFAIGHMVAISLYLRNRRPVPSFSQSLLSWLFVPAVVCITWAMLTPDPRWCQAVLYISFAATMAATAWSSRFSRYRVGAAAMMFVLSDLTILARADGEVSEQIARLLIWPLYFGAQALTAWGVVSVLCGDHRSKV